MWPRKSKLFVANHHRMHRMWCNCNDHRDNLNWISTQLHRFCSQVNGAQLSSLVAKNKRQTSWRSWIPMIQLVFTFLISLNSALTMTDTEAERTVWRHIFFLIFLHLHVLHSGITCIWMPFSDSTLPYFLVSILIVATQMNYSDCHPLAMNIRRRCFSTARVPKILDNCRMYDVLVVPVTK